MELKDSKSIKHIARISKKDLKSFQIFLQSQFHNKNEDLIRLLGVLVKFHPTFSHRNCNEKFICQKLQNQNKKFTISKFNKALHDLYQAAIKFQAVQTLISNKEEWIPKALSKIQKDPAYSSLPQLTNEHIRTIERQKFRKVNDYLSLANNYKYLYSLSVNLDNLGDRSLLVNFRENLEKYYTLEKLEFQCAILSRVNTLVEQLPFDSELNLDISKINHEREPIFYLYKSIIELYTHFNSNLFFKIKDLFYKSIDKLSDPQIQLIYSKLQNFGFLEIRKGDQSFSRELFDLSRFAIDQGFNNTFTSTKFLNIVVIACLAGEIKFANEFIKNYKNSITSQEYSDTVTLSNAFVFFYSDLFDKSYEQLLLINSKKVHFQLRVKTLILRCLYEFYLEESSYEKMLRSKIIALERYFTRDLIIANDSITAYLNFAKILKSFLSKTAQNETEKYKKQVIEELNAMEHIIAKNWLIIKISNL